ncbi:hypothetical protein GCM10010341_40010 [Streptomyces noursei]|nr:hypothetical protein GCM10010341_40010 [Streptomyces noursei]
MEGWAGRVRCVAAEAEAEVKAVVAVAGAPTYAACGRRGEAAAGAEAAEAAVGRARRDNAAMAAVRVSRGRRCGGRG